MKLFSLQDEYITIYGETNPPQYSRVTEESKTRIDVILSNTSQCTEIEYKESGIENIDHRSVQAKYEINLQQKSRIKWLSRKNNSWVFPKELEDDEQFEIGMEIMAENIEGKDNRKDWNEIKKGTKAIAKERTNEKRKQENGIKQLLTQWLQAKMKRIIQGENEWEEYTQI